MNDERLEHLLRRWSDETMDAAEMTELEERLQQSAEARAAFWEMRELEAMIEAECTDTSPALASPLAPAAPTIRSARVRWLTPLLGLGLIAALLSLLLVLRPASHPLAVVSATADAVWGEAIPATGLKAGIYELAAGLVELEFDRGAKVAIQGPARFRLWSQSEMELLEGSIGAHIPEAATGFTVRTSKGKVVDHGTDFAVSVGPDGDAAAHLFSGEIEVVSGDRSLRLHQPGQVSISRDASSDPLAPPSPREFPVPAQERILKVVQGGFEPGTTWQKVNLKEVGRWGGDAAVILNEFLGIRPHEGEGMLQFLASDIRPDEASPAIASQHQQWLDLRPYRHLVDHGSVKLEMSAHFNRVTGTETTDTKFMIVGIVNQGDTIASSKRLNRASVSLFSDDDPSSWEKLSFSMPVSPESDFLLIEILAWENVLDEQAATEREFDGHFADTLEARLIVDLSPSRASKN